MPISSNFIEFNVAFDCSFSFSSRRRYSRERTVQSLGGVRFSYQLPKSPLVRWSIGVIRAAAPLHGRLVKIVAVRLLDDDLFKVISRQSSFCILSLEPETRSSSFSQKQRLFSLKTAATARLAKQIEKTKREAPSSFMHCV